MAQGSEAAHLVKIILRTTRHGTVTTSTVSRRRWNAEGKIRGVAGTRVTLGKRRGTWDGVSKFKRSAYMLYGDIEMMVASAPTIHDQQGQRMGLGTTLIIGANRSQHTARLKCVEPCRWGAQAGDM